MVIFTHVSKTALMTAKMWEKKSNRTKQQNISDDTSVFSCTHCNFIGQSNFRFCQFWTMLLNHAPWLSLTQTNLKIKKKSDPGQTKEFFCTNKVQMKRNNSSSSNLFQCLPTITLIYSPCFFPSVLFPPHTHTPLHSGQLARLHLFLVLSPCVCCTQLVYWTFLTTAATCVRGRLLSAMLCSWHEQYTRLV